jgi:DNA-binding MarR family transcriptional regulator
MEPKQQYKDIDEFYELWGWLLQAAWTLFEVRNKELKSQGITTMQAAALFFIQILGDQATPAEISRWILRKPHTVSGILARMEKNGLVTKAKNFSRKNLVRVTMTEKGRKALTQSTRRKAIPRILSLLPTEDRRKLKSYLRTLRNAGLEELGRSIREIPFPDQE